MQSDSKFKMLLLMSALTISLTGCQYYNSSEKISEKRKANSSENNEEELNKARSNGFMLAPYDKQNRSKAVNDNKRYIISFKAKSPAALAAVKKAGAKTVLDLPKQNALAASIPTAALDALSKHPDIEYIEEDQIRKPLAESVPYGINMVQAALLNDANISDTNVCIIDSGYSMQHEDLQDSNVTSAPDGGAGDAFNDTCGHGTHVAGTIAALSNGVGVVGVNPSGTIGLHIVKVFGEGCSWAYSSDLVHALDQCQNLAGRTIINMSLGGSFKSRTEEKAFDTAFQRGILSIAAAGNDGNTRNSYPASYNSVISVAAIDENKNHASFSQNNDQVELAAPGVGILSTVPWKDQNSLTVDGISYEGNHLENSGRSNSVSGTLVDGGLCDKQGSWTGNIVLCERGSISFLDKVANAENSGASAVIIYNNAAGNFYGTLGDGASSLIPAISLSQEDGQFLASSKIGSSGDLVSIFSANASGYEAWDGTSMATPHVAGVAALVWGNHKAATNQQIRDALDQTAEDLGSAGRDTQFGYGLVQAKSALDWLNNGPQCTPSSTIESNCSDGVDNDCDGLIDLSDSDCDGNSGGSCDLGKPGDFCSQASDCCSNRCKGKPGAMTCK